MNVDNMWILICKSDTFGGANYLLDRLYIWLKSKNYNVEQCILTKGIIPDKRIYNLAILPSYIYDDIYVLSQKGIVVERILLWIMGMGCFQDGYYNPANKRGIKGFVTRMLATEAEVALRDVVRHKSICFTDVVGRYNTFKDVKYADENFENNFLIPIGISTSKFIKNREKREILGVCWVGRVTHDFKYIPLKHVMRDLDKYVKEKNVKICFTIVGDGNAIDDIKKIISEVSYEVRLIHFLEYKELDDFFSKQDIAFVMGTSALDAARNSCPSVVVNPVREDIDEEKVFYRWIYDSKGYSLGEYPGWDEMTGQPRKQLIDIMEEYYYDDSASKKCWEYANKFDENLAFKKILNIMPMIIDKSLWKHIKKYYLWKMIIKKYIKIKKLFHNNR